MILEKKMYFLSEPKNINTLILRDDRLAVAAAEARHPLEPPLGVQGHDEELQFQGGHLLPGDRTGHISPHNSANQRAQVSD